MNRSSIYTLGCLSLFGAALIAVSAKADSLDGTWTASALRVSWSIGDWGKDCGPRPSGGGEPGGSVTITSSGAGFTLSGLGRNYSSSQCWEQMPGLATRSRSTGKDAMQITCTMPPGDPRHAKVTTSWFPQGDTIVFDETGQYKFAVLESTCTASVRRTRTLTRIKTAARGPTPPKAAVGSAPSSSPPRATNTEGTPAIDGPPSTQAAPPPPPERSTACRTPGPPVRLEVTPRTKLMRQGENFQFSAIARDRAGCRAPVATVWRLVGTSSATLTAGGMLKVPADAPGEKLEIEASVAAQAVRVSARIVSAQEFDQLLEGGHFGTLGESLDGAEIALASGYVQLDETKPVPAKKPSKLLWGLGGLIALSAVATFALLRRTKRRTDPRTARRLDDSVRSSSDSVVTEGESTDTALTSSHIATPAAEHMTPPVRKRLCPVCGKRYEEGTAFCAEDGARLMRGN